jgi:hypothetical protein
VRRDGELRTKRTKRGCEWRERTHTDHRDAGVALPGLRRERLAAGPAWVALRCLPAGDWGRGMNRQSSNPVRERRNTHPGFAVILAEVGRFRWNG